MTDKEKIKKFEEIQKQLWKTAAEGNVLQSIMASNIIRLFEIPGPNGQRPEES